MIKRCEKCGRVASATLQIKVGELEVSPLLCKSCTHTITSKVSKIIESLDTATPTKIISRLEFKK